MRTKSICQVEQTAYNEQESRTYDLLRFSSPQGRAFHELEIGQLRAFLRLTMNSGLALEVGCGTGRFLDHVAAAGFHVVGLDPSRYMLGICQQKYCNNKDISFVLGEGALLPYESSRFDVVYSIRTLNQTASEHCALRIVSEMIRVTKPGGNILIEFCNKRRFNSRRSKKQALLTVSKIRRTINRFCDAQVRQVNGILFFSQTLLNRVPPFFLSKWLRIDAFISERLPWYCSRCYIIIKKGRQTD
jgi:ubiquinone/menaquinone biosynthesis C-methylase UbiE